MGREPLRKVGGRRRRAVGASPRDWVEVRPLLDDKLIPLVIEPRVEGLSLIEWTESNRPFIDELLAKHHALLFRGFQTGGLEGFERFVDTSTDGERLTYKDRSTPRKSYGDRIYNATVYPSEQSINLHNEGTYWMRWAQRIYFACVTNARTGGETPIADVHGVYMRIDPSLRREFEARKVLYVRNYNHGFGLPWQEVFQTESPAEVEEYCNQNDIEFEWLGGERLRTRAIRPAVRTHPVNGKPLWFNHACFFHVSSLEPSLREALERELEQDELPFNTFYGDGIGIPQEVIAHIQRAYDAERVVFRWREGDVALYDNMRIAHARQPFEGERLTLVALTDVYDPAQAENERKTA